MCEERITSLRSTGARLIMETKDGAPTVWSGAVCGLGGGGDGWKALGRGDGVRVLRY